MTEMTEPETLGQVAYAAFGELLAGENVAFGCGLPFDALPPEVQDGFEKAGSALIRTPAAATWNDPSEAAAEAPSTVTVTTPDGPHDVLTADRWQEVRPGVYGGGLQVFSGSLIVAEYQPGKWDSIVDDGHRAPSGPPVRPERAEELERLLSRVRIALSQDGLDDSERLAEIRDAANHVTARPATD
jgi:hypothetical protein